MAGFIVEYKTPSDPLWPLSVGIIKYLWFGTFYYNIKL
jgi:hypothetical protein